MATYRVQVHGTNFLVDLEGRVARRGFLTFRIVEAPDAAQAETLAIEQVRTTPRLRDVVRNAPEDPPVMEVEELVELDPGLPVPEVPPGFVWYEDAPRPWWKFWGN